ncbi:MAG: hypothetical protein U0835_14060 [Isosphaeraceae bacterium]
MRLRRVSGRRLALSSLVAVLSLAVWTGPARAQRLAGADDPNIAQGATQLPPVPPQGAWGEVIMANARWLVVQNHQGQQFPIAANSINQFLIRWPTSFENLTGNSMVEAIGVDLGSNVLRTDHVDVFEGSNQNLVAPTYASVLPNNRVVTTIDPGFNRFMNGFDVGAQNLLYGWAYPVDPGDGLGIPGRLHVVGSVAAVGPLRLRVPGNNIATVLPMEPGVLVLTEITRGNTTFAEKGDLVYLMPVDLRQNTVVLSQLVLYKKIPFRQFRLP